MESVKLALTLTEATRRGGGSFNLDGSTIENGYLIGGGILKTDDALATINIEEVEEGNLYEVIVEAFIDIIEDNQTEIKNFDGLGVWVSDNIIYLDAINVELHRLDAIELGNQRKQQAIGHLTKGRYTEITLRH
jgi:hypothetical protein